MNVLQVSTRSPEQQLDGLNRVRLDFLARGMDPISTVSLGELDPTQAEIVQEHVGDRRFVMRRRKGATF